MRPVFGQLSDKTDRTQERLFPRTVFGQGRQCAAGARHQPRSGSPPVLRGQDRLHSRAVIPPDSFRTRPTVRRRCSTSTSVRFSPKRDPLPNRAAQRRRRVASRRHLHSPGAEGRRHGEVGRGRRYRRSPLIRLQQRDRGLARDLDPHRATRRGRIVEPAITCRIQRGPTASLGQRGPVVRDTRRLRVGDQLHQ